MILFTVFLDESIFLFSIRMLKNMRQRTNREAVTCMDDLGDLQCDSRRKGGMGEQLILSSLHLYKSYISIYPIFNNFQYAVKWSGVMNGGGG